MTGPRTTTALLLKAILFLVLAPIHLAWADCPWTLLCTTDYDGPLSNTDIAQGLAIDGAENILVAGRETGIGGGADWRVRRYNSTLTTLLSSTDYSSAGIGDAGANALCVDGAGNVVVVGYEDGDASAGINYKWRVSRYDPTLSTLLSSTEYEGPGNGNDQAFAVAVDGSGNVVVVGGETGSLGGANWRVRRYDPTLTTLLSSTDYNGPGNGVDSAQSVSSDGSGNVVVAGYEVGTVGGTNWRIRRYDPTLTMLLSTTDYDGPVNGVDTARAVAVDGSGNVVVVGYETGSVGGMNWRVRRYDSTLTSLLASTDYSGSGSSNDAAASVAIDGAANVVVAGSTGTLGAANWTVRSWNPTLTSLLSATDFDGSGASGDAAFSVVLDGVGGVVVAGYESATTGGTNWRVQKYSTGSGTIIAGVMVPAYPVNTGQVFPVLFTVTNTGCGPVAAIGPSLEALPFGGAAILVTGPAPAATPFLWPGQSLTFTWTFSATAAGLVNFSGTVTGYDPSLSATVIVASTGTMLIQTPAGLTGAIAVAPATVYPGDAITLTVTVSKTGQADAANVKGATAALVTGVAAARALGPTPAGPFTLTGSGSQTFTWIYTAGLTPGSLTFSVSALGNDANSGAKLSTGMLTVGGVTILSPFEPCPSTLASPDPFIVFDGPANGDDRGNGIAVDVSGSVFVAAREDREDFGRQGDGFVGYYPPGGGPLFTYQEFASVGSVEDYAAAVAVAPGGLLFYGGAQGNAALIGARTTAGVALWEITVPAPGGGASDARGVASDPAGNLVVTGRQFAAGQGDNLWLAKYTSAGALMWTVNNNSAPNSGEAGYAVAVDPSGSIYVAGYETRNDLAQGRNIVVWKYGPGGALLWKRTDNSLANGTDEGRGVAVDPAGNVYACGFETRSDLGQAENGWVRKYDANGNILWTASFNAPIAPAGGPNDRANAIALAPSADVYVTGREERAGQNGNIVLRRYDANGLLLEVQIKNGPANGNEQGNGVAVGPNGIVYVVGTEDWTLSQNENYTVRRWTRPGCLDAALFLSQPVGSVGQWITAVLTVTNSGSSPVTTLIPTLAFPAGMFAVINGPTPASVASVAVGASASFTWTLSVSGSGAAVLTGTGTGTESATSKTVSASASAGFLAQSAAQLAGSLSAPSLACVGQVITVTATVSNTGQATATGVGVPDPLFLEGPGSVVTLTAPAGLTTLPGGATVTLTWTFSAAGLGAVRFTATATGMDVNGSAPVSSGPFTSGALTVTAPAFLDAQAAGPGLAPVGAPFTVTLTITNTGAGPATGVAPKFAVSPPGAPLALLGLSPSGSVSIAAGAQQTFIWTFSTAGWGAATFTLSVSGADGCGNVAASATVYALLGSPAALVAAGPWASPSPICVGRPFTITMTVTNTGDVPANVLTPGFLAVGGGGSATLISGPSTLTGLVGGAAAHLIWTYSATGPGALFLTATVTATDGRTGGALSTGPVTSNTVTVTSAAVLAAAAAAPPTAIVGQWITATLTVTNTGGQDAVNITASPYGNSGLLTWITGPAPSAPVTIPAGAAQTFVWTYSLSGAGPLGVTLSVTGQTCGGLATLQVAAPLSVTGLRPATLVATGFQVVPAAAPIGSTFTASCTVSNGGDADLTVTALFRSQVAGSTGGLGAASVASPSPAFTLTGGGSQAVIWTYTASAPCGVFSLQAQAAGMEIGTGRPLFTAVLTSNVATITGTATGLAFSAAVAQADVAQPVTLTAVVTDSCGLGVPLAQVFFTVLDGAGTLSTMSGFTDPAGRINVVLTLGPDQETDHVRATIFGTGLTAVVAVSGVNPLLLKEPGAALDRNAVSLGNGEVVLARIYPRTDEPVQVRIFTASGRLVRTLNRTTPMGRGQLLATWDGRTQDEFRVARGVYLVVVEGGGLKRTILKVVVK